MLVVPVPSFGVNRLTHRAKDTQTAKIIVLHVLSTQSAKETNGSRSRIKLGNLVLLDSLPVAGWGGVNWSGFEDGSADTICEWSINDVGVTSNPTDISHAGELVVWVNIEYVFYGKGGAKEVSASSMNDTLRFSRRTRSLDEDEKSGLSNTRKKTLT
jgi:hypothetical protein